MSQYILLLRGGKSSADTNPEEIGGALESYRNWVNQLRQDNRLVDAAKLDNDGRRLLKKSGSIQVDGPFTETKETIGGFYIIEAESQDIATEIARNCPIFAEGGTVEIREVQN